MVAAARTQWAMMARSAKRCVTYSTDTRPGCSCRRQEAESRYFACAPPTKQSTAPGSASSRAAQKSSTCVMRSDQPRGITCFQQQQKVRREMCHLPCVSQNINGSHHPPIEDGVPERAPRRRAGVPGRVPVLRADRYVQQPPNSKSPHREIQRRSHAQNRHKTVVLLNAVCCHSPPALPTCVDDSRAQAGRARRLRSR